ncbi:unnamed protein product [Brachionus calyciflorus]|uniref:Probable RNA polymerase II nuclear localization protein SLC7A6OS n=1 Tax=Brachionus calyciflorus TaxID=104777 RepID=A0A814GWE2_9BILA|nr:unnamed protein product [Brachionus calyciflorus]
MCTIIKVKRKITEDPLECLILECKKKKIDENDSIDKKSFKQILKYGGSAQTEEELPAKIKELSTLKNAKNVPLKLADNKNEQKQLNFTIKNKKRGLSIDHETDEQTEDEDSKKIKVCSESKNINIIDVVLTEKSPEKKNKNDDDKKETITCNGVNLIREKCEPQETGYVYDIYYTKNSDIHLDLLYPNNYEIRSYNVYQDIDLIDDTVQKEVDPDHFYDDEDEDSNDEDNWRNDYPDEEDNIDDEDDDEPYAHRTNGYNDSDYDDYENGYNDYQDDDEYGGKLAAYMKKSMNLERSYNEDDSFDEEYEKEEFEDQMNKYGYSKSYAEYKQKMLKELKKDYESLDD